MGIDVPRARDVRRRQPALYGPDWSAFVRNARSRESRSGGMTESGSLSEPIDSCALTRAA